MPPYDSLSGADTGFFQGGGDDQCLVNLGEKRAKIVWPPSEKLYAGQSQIFIFIKINF